MNLNLKKFVGIFSYYLAPLGMAVATYFFPDPDLFIWFGRGALGVLAMILFVKPLAAIFKINSFWTIVSWRRELGVLIFWLFAFHAGWQIYAYSLYFPEVWFELPLSIYFGALAGFGLFVLTITANNFMVRLLKRNWKRLHYSAYVIFFFALLHRAFITGQFILSLSVFFVFAVLKIIEFRKLKKPVSPPVNN